MAEVSETEARARRIPAYALLRAAVAQDADAAVLLVDQARKAGTLDLLVFNVAQVAARAMLGAEGYDVAKVVRVLDSWMGRGGTRRPVPTRADSMTDGELAAEEAKVGRTVAAYAMVRAMLARDTWTMARILDRWATGPGTEGMDFAAAVAGVGAALAIGMADGDRDRALDEADEALAAAAARQVPRVRAV
jgi:hypothetical protein